MFYYVPYILPACHFIFAAMIMTWLIFYLKLKYFLFYYRILNIIPCAIQSILYVVVGSANLKLLIYCLLLLW